MTGYLQVYTGNGKGKTTAAIGLTVRAAGAGMRVLFLQFAKGMEYSEHKALARFSDLVTVRQYGRRCFINDVPEQEDVALAQKGLAEAAAALRSGDYQVVVLDEACIALHYKLFTLEELLQAIRERHAGCEVVVTGRNAPSALVDAADLVTGMTEVKHYYTKGVEARVGIEK